MQGQRQSSSGLKKSVKHLQSAPELRWPKFTQNDFFEKLVLTHPPTFWPGVGNFSFWNPLLDTALFLQNQASYEHKHVPP